MCFNLPDSKSRRSSCCGLTGIKDARRVCHALDIKHYVLNFSRALEEKVIKDFCAEYLSGRTPNPCVRCNQYLKFDALLKKALSLDADYLATGHYARIDSVRRLAYGACLTGRQVPRFLLKKAKDKTKDQSYFLYRLNQDQLKYIIFPLGNYTKAQVRLLAKKMKLPVADKPGSQEICFLPDNDYRSFLNAKMNTKHKNLRPGPIVDKEGKILGRHKGSVFYTIGQREGLGIALGHPAYVIDISPKANRIVVGNKEEACSTSFIVKEPHFISHPIKNKVVSRVKIRYNTKEQKVQIQPFKRTLKVTFFKPQFAITPGQSAVFYQKDTILGGGIISRVL
jgi:tRNA-specific 2-thiouridylase